MVLGGGALILRSCLLPKEHMRNLHLEAAIWKFFSSPKFFAAAASECDEIAEWFENILGLRDVANLGRNNQIFDKFKQRANEFRLGAQLARQGNYEFIWKISDCMRGDARGMMEQPLHSWMTDAQYQEFSGIRLSRLLAYDSSISHALDNAFVGADSFFDPDPEWPEGSNDDGGFPGDKIVKAYQSYTSLHDKRSFQTLPNPLPECVIDWSVVCRTGEEVPWTGVWYPSVGLEGHSLTFAIEGLRMQPVYQVTKTVQERERESEGAIFSSPETVAIATSWHPVMLSGRHVEIGQELRAKAGEPCPKAGTWQPMEPGAVQRVYKFGETMASLGSAYGITVWMWIAD